MTTRRTRVPPNAPRRSLADEANLLLRALPTRSYRRLLPHLTAIELEVNAVLWQPDDRLDWVYFPRTCVTSLLVVLESAPPVEAATVGREGMMGMSAVLGAEHASGRAIAQVRGTVARLSANVLRKLLVADSGLRRAFLLYAEMLQRQIAQSVACNARHTIEQRCARWLLATHDRVGRDDFDLLQSFLAAMLGVHRPRVTIAASRLQRDGLIRYSRGHLEIVDRRGLERASCECYAAVKATIDEAFADRDGRERRGRRPPGRGSRR
jgi:CRP-like cAMP-binding protein